MFNKQELEYLYTAVNMIPPPSSTQGGRAKAHMIAKLCDLIDEVNKTKLQAVNSSTDAAATSETAQADLD